MFKNLKKKKNNKGFTLVELLVVIAIIGILAVVAVPSLFKNINRAKATDVVAYLSAAKTAAVSEYAATQTPGTLNKDQLAELIEDVPTEVTAASVTIDADGKIAMTVTVTGDKLKAEVQKQATANFGGTTVTVN